MDEKLCEDRFPENTTDLLYGNNVENYNLKIIIWRKNNDIRRSKKRADYHFSINDMDRIIEDIRKGWLDDFEENGDPVRGAAVLEIGHVDIEVNIFSEEQLCREGREIPDDKKKAPAIDYFVSVKAGKDKDSWRDDKYLETKVNVDWRAENWKELLEHDMFMALDNYVRKAGYSYDHPNLYIQSIYDDRRICDGEK